MTGSTVEPLRAQEPDRPEQRRIRGAGPFAHALIGALLGFGLGVPAVALNGQGAGGGSGRSAEAVWESYSDTLLASGRAGALGSAMVGLLLGLTLSSRTLPRRGTPRNVDAREASDTALCDLRDRLEQMEQRYTQAEESRQSLMAEMESREIAAAVLVETQKLDAVGRLSAQIAHDFNNILTVILNYADFAKDGPKAPGELLASLEAISAATVRAGQLPRHLLGFARRQIVETRTTTLDETSSPIEQRPRTLVGEDIGVEFALARQPSNVLIDPGQLEQLLVNLAAPNRAIAHRR
jgi:C4-dicarboxylate-specific signal transduction histidine kinase